MKANFKYTNTAKEFKKYFLELDFIGSPEKCLNGVPPMIPALNNGLEKLETVLREIRTGLCAQNQSCLQQINTETISLIESSLHNFLENATICLVTSKDDGHTKIDVENIFARQGQNKTVPSQTKLCVPELCGDESTKLGVYIPDTGTIMLWIDRIFQYSQPELLFQKVLLHELIHAMMDISPRTITNGKAVRFNSAYDSDKEECYDNTLVLYCYEWAISDNTFYKYVKDFIAHQHIPYSDAIAEHDNISFIDFKRKLTDHLKSKLIPSKSSASSTRYQYSLSYTDDEFDDQITFNEAKDIIKEIIGYNSDEELQSLGTSIVYLDAFWGNESLPERLITVRLIYREKSKNSPIQLAIQYKDVLCLYDIWQDKLTVVGTLKENENEFIEWLIWVIKNLNPESNIDIESFENNKPQEKSRIMTNQQKDSYIRIVCSANANRENNRLRLRTDDVKYIELEPGENILKLSDYPELEKGFRQFLFNEEIDGHKCMPYKNCQEVIEVDFSHFDGSQMTSMAFMFGFMKNIKKFSFGGLDTSNVKSFEGTFIYTELPDDFTLDFNMRNQYNCMLNQATNFSCMFLGCKAKKLDLSRLYTGLANKMNYMFYSCDIHELVLTGLYPGMETKEGYCDQMNNFYLYGGNSRPRILVEGADSDLAERVNESSVYYNRDGKKKNVSIDVKL